MLKMIRLLRIVMVFVHFENSLSKLRQSLKHKYSNSHSLNIGSVPLFGQDRNSMELYTVNFSQQLFPYHIYFK